MKNRTGVGDTIENNVTYPTSKTLRFYRNERGRDSRSAT